MPVLAKDLRSSVLKNAVSGKLSQTLKTDTPIEDLLNCLHYDNKLETFEEPFDIPTTWRWIQIGNLGASIGTDSFADGPFGSNLKKEHQINKPEVRIIQLSNIGDDGWKDENVKYTSFKHLETISRCEVNPGNFVIAKMMPAGRAIIMPDLRTKITLGSDAVKFVPNEILNKDYLLLAMKSDAFLNQVYAEVHGITRIRTSLNKIKSYALPIPPVEEQSRIVTKVNELMSKIDEYEKLENELVELKENFPGDMKDAILQAAMEGKLTEQSKNEVSSLIDKKADENDYDFEVPENWSVVKMTSVTDMYTGNSISESVKKAKYMKPQDGYKYIGTKDVSFEHEIDYNNGVIIPFNETKFKIAKKNATLLCIEGGSAGKKIGMISQDVCFGNKLCSFNASDEIDSKYQYYLLQSPIFKKTFYENLSGMIGGVSINKLKEMFIPLPPIEEQKRIVEKLDKLIPLTNF